MGDGDNSPLYVPIQRREIDAWPMLVDGIAGCARLVGPYANK